MRFTFTVKIGETEFEISDDAANPAEMFQKVAFWQSLPTEGPNGETDLKLSYRTPQGYEYYSIISEQADQEFKLGQKMGEEGQLFPKRWEPLVHGNGHDYEGEEPPPPPSRQASKATQRQTSSGKSGQTTSTTSSKPATYQDFWTYQRSAKIAKATADDIMNKHTSQGATNWTQALRELQAAG